MIQQVEKISYMLFSKDDGMRNLGRLLSKGLSLKEIDVHDKAFLLLNSSDSNMVAEGARLFLRKKRNMKDWEKLLACFRVYGYTSTAMWGLKDILWSYKRTKKIAGYFEDPDYLKEQFEGYPPRFDGGYDDLKDNYIR